MLLSKIQLRYIFHWLAFILIGEIFILASRFYAWVVFLFAGIGFIIAFILRIIKKYPGKPEPLILDISSGILAIISGIICYTKEASLVIRLIFPLIIITPHFIYIITNKNLS